MIHRLELGYELALSGKGLRVTLAQPSPTNNTRVIECQDKYSVILDRPQMLFAKKEAYYFITTYSVWS